MTDRELLELAAKAAGILTQSWYGNEAYIDGMLSRWNPLTDDGDALRLAVSQKMGIHYETQYYNGEYVEVIEVYHSHEDDACQCVTEPLGEDPMAATRRAITRAAAEIGKQK